MAGEAAAIGRVPRAQPRVVAWFRRHTFEIVLILPLVAYITVLTVAPIIDTFRISFSSPAKGFGTLDSYQAIFKDTVFRHAVVNTIIVALLSLVLEVSVGLAIALTLHVKFFGRGFVRTVRGSTSSGRTCPGPRPEDGGRCSPSPSPTCGKCSPS